MCSDGVEPGTALNVELPCNYSVKYQVAYSIPYIQACRINIIFNDVALQVHCNFQPMH